MRQKSRSHFVCNWGWTHNVFSGLHTNYQGHLRGCSPCSSCTFRQQPLNILLGVCQHVSSRLSKGSKAPFHFKNHTNCCVQSTVLPNVLPAGYNTQAAEQTFSWLGLFKNVVNSMTQMHHLFYLLHRMIKRRNSYTERCRPNNWKTVIPLVPRTVK
ncbi:hypothetical protein MAR_022091 [Mya arenaria]|uniref:Uncharacterized protein n=1 Tax=Mya arenaria TaxID=6604 RepID=A0ABY7DLF8_MYAAR|nr:hypothetical protein MAR_022091 [Mya arenaria]